MLDHSTILRNLISIDTSVPPGSNYEKAIDYLIPLFKEAACDTYKVAIPFENAEGREGRFALVAHRRESGKSRLIFYCHVDVVPADGWDAFNPKVEMGKIYGRGAADMKGAIASLLVALYEVKDQLLQYDVSVMVTTDEEDTQADQLRYLKKFLEPVAGAGIFSLDSNFGFVSVANLGLLQMDIVIRGKSVHSGLAHLGENAIEQAVPVLQALVNLKKKVVKRRSNVKLDPSTGIKVMEGRLNINVIKGGIKANIVPDSCTITIDRRLIPEEKIEDAEKEIIDAVNKIPGIKWELGKAARIPTIPASEGDEIDKLAGVLKKVTGKTGKYGEMGSGDLTAIAGLEWNARSYGLGVIRTESNIHGKEEYAYLKDIQDLTAIIKQLLTG